MFAKLFFLSIFTSMKQTNVMNTTNNLSYQIDIKLIELFSKREDIVRGILGVQEGRIKMLFENKQKLDTGTAIIYCACLRYYMLQGEVIFRQVMKEQSEFLGFELDYMDFFERLDYQQADELIQI